MNPNTQLLANWINERERVRINREAGKPKPWTDDPILRSVRFCNVHREDDKVTRWLAKHWREPLAKHDNLVAAMVLARMVNRIETLEQIPLSFITDWSLRMIKDAINRRRSQGYTVWGSAYMISTCGKPMDKVDYVVDHVVRGTYELDWSTSMSKLETLYFNLRGVDGLGSFLAGQVVADIKNIKGHPLSQVPDWWKWSIHGPGSLKGLSEYFATPITPSGYQEAIDTCYNETMPLVHDYVGEIHMQDFQNCMCEFSKYVRVRNGGRAKNGYPG